MPLTFDRFCAGRIELDRKAGFGTYGRMRLIYWPFLAAMCLPLDAYAANFSEGGYLPDCAGSVEIVHARVARVEQNGALILPDGRAVLLEGIRLPQRGDGPRFLADQALSALREMALAGPVTFTTTAPKEDRYHRIRAQGFGRQWFQVALLERSLARVAIAPDRNECAPDLYEAEARARAQQAGIWALAEYRTRSPQEMKGTAGTFQLVDGWVTNVSSGGGRVFIDFGSNGQRSFSAVIASEDRRAFRDFDLDGLATKHIRIRGTVQDYRGRPEIALSNPSQIEVLNCPPPAFAGSRASYGHLPSYALARMRGRRACSTQKEKARRFHRALPFAIEDRELFKRLSLSACLRRA
jgi:micrococcal nuclease